jgi:alpha-D-ribose 1-methylphosphonate 5-triphosphate diphosphatase
MHGVPLASHDDDTIEKVALMQELGANISEFPVTIEAAREAKARGMANAMGAPNALRGMS